MPVRAELDRGARSLDGDAPAARRASPRGVDDRVALAADVGDVAFLEVDDAPRDRQQRGGVGGEEVLAVAQADDQRAAVARADDAAGLARRDDGDRVRAVEFGGRAPAPRAAGRRRRGVPVRVDQVRDDLGVGLRREDVALRARARRAAPRSSR